MRFPHVLRRFRLTSLLLVGAVVATTLGVGGTAPVVEEASAAGLGKPNIVLFLLDDATVQDMKYMPKTRRLLGGAGMTFTNMINQNPLCCPARAQILTAQLDHNNGVLTNQGHYGGEPAMKSPNNTLGAWMKAAGYHNAVYGKHLNRYVRSRDGVPPGWDTWDVTIDGGLNYWHFTTSTECPRGLVEAACIRETSAKKRYTTHVMRDKIVAQIDEWSGDDQPFFVYANWVAPHKDQKGTAGEGLRGVPKPEPKYANLYAGERNYAERKSSFNEADMSDKTADMLRWEKKPRAMLGEHFLGRIRSLASADDAVEATVAKLKQTGEFDNTIFLFSSDNGFMNGEHRLTYKKWAFWEALRVPLIMTGPGVPRGTRTNRWVTMVDLSATILGAAGATSRRGSVDGKSFLATRPGSDYEPRPLLIGSGQEFARNNRDKGWAYRGVMWGRYIWTKHWSRNGTALGEQFYDLVTDPNQTRSRPKAKNYQRVIKRMKRYYSKRRGCKGSACVAAQRREPNPG